MDKKNDNAKGWLWAICGALLFFVLLAAYHIGLNCAMGG
jgi:hypothetical protein